MIHNSVERVLARIHSIEAKFTVKTTEGFSSHLNEAIRNTESSVRNSNQSQVEQIVRNAAQRHGVKPDLAMAVARSESNLSQQAVSPVGAIGVMQLMPETAKALGVRDIHDVRENVDGGVRYLKQLLHSFKDERLAVAAYNAGPEAVRQYQGIPPYQETQSYVENVFRQIAGGK